METQKWINQSHPQTLVIAVYLLYFDAFFSIINLLTTRSPLFLVLGAGAGAAGYGIANDRNWAYWLGVGVSVLGVLFNLGNILGLMFAVAQLALLLHPMSRSYQKVWFR